ncbi:DsbA family oxidoreductase [Saccharomonospora xinjiangensis]|uniref:Putative dithiol-disulfide isomerase involved in polyketide biosynthesis n=1 Tax=Saccharomonospora xinjiangensis XJ-54 TaxID=882086 RepID=I0V4U0_9PSEU|nr:DsbA family protein [Saccharomonospora xinjiangensis]EID55143.1 putative dithiol-disulfide isomerase involved in polyketide biosynthesis [Saccharomonospora xinjiangensis XJ-54]
MSTKVEVFVDYVCPFCFLVEDAVAELERDRDVEVEIRPFELRPDPVPTLRPEDDYLPNVWSRSVYPMAERLGMDITLPSSSPQPRTAKAFVVLQLAKERGIAAEYSSAMFRAFFQQDRNIGLDEVIVEVATSVGLDRDDVEKALASEERFARQRDDQRYAAELVGVTAVPSFRIDGRLYSGVLDADQLKQAADNADNSAARERTA